MHLLGLSIHTKNAEIGIETRNARQEIKSPPGNLTIDQRPPEVNIHSEDGTLSIDQSDAWAGLGVGGNLRWQSNIYSQCKDIALRGIARIVEDGKRMAQTTNPRNAFADLARDWNAKSGMNYSGSPTYFGVKTNYEAHPAQINIEPQKADIHFEPQKPVIQYIPGDVSIYLKQKESIDIRVSEYSWHL